MTTRVTEGARRGALVSRVSRLLRSTLARASIPLTKSEEKETLLPVYAKVCRNFCHCVNNSAIQKNDHPDDHALPA